MVVDREPLPADVQRLLRSGHGVFHVREAERLRISRGRVARLAQAGALTRLADGAYVDAWEYAKAGEWTAFALRSRAFTLACGPQAVAAAWSAGVLLDVPTISSPPSLPLAFVPHGVRAGSNNMYGCVRAVALPRSHCAFASGCWLTPLPRTVVDIARTSSRADALVVADAALSTRMSAVALRRVLDFEAGWRGVRDATWVVEHADPYAESPLETLGRLTFIEYGLPLPISNAWVEVGRDRYRVDHLLPDRWLAFEGDGSLKYDGRGDAGRVVAEQREREWRLRESGVEVVRYGWDLARHDRGRLAARFRQIIADRPARPEPIRWWRAPAPTPRLGSGSHRGSG